jgi:hypothetical protein
LNVLSVTGQVEEAGWLFCYPAIQLSSQELKKNIILCRAARDTPIRGANDTPGRTQPILPRSNTPLLSGVEKSRTILRCKGKQGGPPLQETGTVVNAGAAKTSSV